MTRTAWWVGLVAVMCTACVGAPGVDVAVEAVIPAGSNAAFVSSTIPTAMNPGERLDVSVTMRNTGTSGDPANTWTTAAPTYAFFRTGATTFGLNYDNLQSTTTTGNTTTFNFVITAPNTAGTYSFVGRMGIVGESQKFGDTVTIAGIDVNAANPRRWGCTFVAGSSTIPSTLAVGENADFIVVVQNTGTATWTAPGHLLYSQDTPVSLWNNLNRAITTTVLPGGTATVVVPVTAPATVGAHRFRRQVWNNTTVGFFDNVTSCVDVTVTVGGSAAFDSLFVSNTLPSVLAPSEPRTVTVTVRNTGSASWPVGTTTYLRSANSPIGLYGTILDYPTANTDPTFEHTFSFNITAPATPAMYDQVWRMYTSTGFFGPTLTVPLLVDGASPPALDAAVDSQSIPTVMTAAETASFTVTMRNTGTGTWSGSSYSLYSTNTPLSVWGLNLTPLGAAETVAPTATRAFVFTVTAPAAAGMYESRWRMRETAGFFGAEAVTSGITVTLCGNATLDAGEQCDDDNLVGGDGCSSTCQVEVVSYDLATDVIDRTLIESNLNHQLSTVAIGDFTGDGVRDVVVADATHVTPPMMSIRNAAGTVFGFSGVGFFTSSSTTLPTGNTFRVFGASANDRLGARGGSDLDIGDVTGDGTADLVVSATNADGEMEARANAGEVYVITGGAGLTGDIDLGAATPPTQLAARIIGATAGDRLRVLAVGELSGDTAADLVLASHLADTANGVDSGAVYVVLGGAALTGTVDLSAPGAVTVYTIAGPAAGAQMGVSAAVGNFAGDATGDLIVGNPNFTSAGLTRRGATWGFVGPITGNLDAGAPVGGGGPSFAWLGETQNDNLGSSVAIGNVAGTTAADVVIGAYQQRRAGAQVGAVDVWDGAGLVVGTTYDLSLGALPTAMFRGEDQFDNAGTALALADINNDGYLDIPVASGLADGVGNGRTGSGEVSVYFGSSTLSGTTDLNITPGRLHVYGGAASDGLGLDVPGIAFGDIDGDGFADLCVGSFQGGAARGGRVDCIQSPY